MRWANTGNKEKKGSIHENEHEDVMRKEPDHITYHQQHHSMYSLFITQYHTPQNGRKQ